MDPDRWRRAKELFQAAIELPQEARAAFLREGSQGDAALLREAEALLAGHRTDSFMEGPAAAELVTEPERLPGRHIGPYRVEREIGRGGMGAVYLAMRDDDAYRKQVAIKLVKRGMDTDFVLRRFRNERQILAQLDHPGIAKLLDGGTTEDGRPYLVMELVEGEPITSYCEGRGLAVRVRMELLRRVCAAVQYAHQGLVVHRDLKPANILVTHEGHPKLLDFGIAKILDPTDAGEAATVTALRMLTPQYASPEQVKGQPITTASDVYSLGVLLFELLTGRRPYRVTTGSSDEVARAIVEQEIERPSVVVAHSRMRGDLDTITLKALQKDPARRYGSVEQLSEDLRRYLSGLPVLARPDTLRYRTAKFVARHRVGVAAAALVLLSLVFGMGAALWQARIAEAERQRAETEKQRAEQRFELVRRISGTLIFEVHDSIKTLTGATQARALLARRAAEYLDGLSRDAAGNVTLQRELAEAYIRLGEIQGLHGDMANLGDSAGMVASFNKALELAESAHMLAGDDDVETRMLLAKALDRAARTVQDADPATSVSRHRRALSIRQRLADDHPTRDVHKRPVVSSLLALGDTTAWAGDIRAALEAHVRAVEYREAFGGADRGNQLGTLVGRVGYSLERISGILAARFRDARGARAVAVRALTEFRRSVEYRQAALAERPDNGVLRGSLADSQRKIAETCARTGDRLCFETSYATALATFEALARAEPSNAEASENVLVSRERRALYRTLLGDVRGALADYAVVFPGYLAATERDPSNLRRRRDAANAYERRALARLARGDLGRAERDLVEALRRRQDLLADSVTNAWYLSDYAQTLTLLAQLLGQVGRDEEAARLTHEGLKALRQRADSQGAAACALGEYAWLALTSYPPESRDPAGALRYARLAPAMQPDNPELLATLALALHETGDPGSAVSTAVQAYALMPGAAAGRDEQQLKLDLAAGLEQLASGPIVMLHR